MFTGVWIYKNDRIMSLDTVLKIGNILRKSKEKMSFSKILFLVLKMRKDVGLFVFVFQ